MVYIQLSSPIVIKTTKNDVKVFDRVRIKEFLFFDNNNEQNVEKTIGFKYQVYKKEEDRINVLTENHKSITNQQFINEVIKPPSGNLSAYDFMCRRILEYLINDLDIFSGTIEIE